ncbi:MAG: hypothetical protein AB7R89_16025 [Dehalococcoidia bacterium]
MRGWTRQEFDAIERRYKAIQRPAGYVATPAQIEELIADDLPKLLTEIKRLHRWQ